MYIQKKPILNCLFNSEAKGIILPGTDQALVACLMNDFNLTKERIAALTHVRVEKISKILDGKHENSETTMRLVLLYLKMSIPNLKKEYKAVKKSWPQQINMLAIKKLENTGNNSPTQLEIKYLENKIKKKYV